MVRQVLLLRAARPVLLGLVVAVVLGGCTILGLPEGDNLTRELEDEERANRNPATTFEQRAELFCTARAEADRAMALYRLLREQALAEGDEEGAAWLREGWLGARLFEAVQVAVLTDPRHVSLPSTQEPQRAELVALVCERCPQTATATTELQRELYETPGRPALCVADEAAAGPRTTVLQGTMLLTEVSTTATPRVCDTPDHYWFDASESCRACFPPLEQRDCDAAWVGQALPAQLPLDVGDLVVQFVPDESHRLAGDDWLGPWQVRVPVSRGWELRGHPPSELQEGAIAFELQDREEGRLELTGTVSRDADGRWLASGSFTGTQSLNAFLEGRRGSVCNDRCGDAPPGDRIHITGTWTLEEP